MDYLIWPIVAILAIVITMRFAGISQFPIVAIAHDALPLLLGLAWIVGLFAAVTERWIMLGFAIALIAVQLQLIIPRMRADPVPSWASSDPSISIVCANVFVDNETPAEFASMLMETDADVIVIVESNAIFLDAFEAAGGQMQYPYCVDDPNDESEYAVTIRSRIELHNGSEPVDTGSIKLVRAVVACGAKKLNILGVNPYATIDRGGYKMWRKQMAELAQYVGRLALPIVVVGDINASQYRPGFDQFLRSANLTDAHDAAGKGLTHSLKLSARGLLAVLPAVARLDHALSSDDVYAKNIVDLPMAGSDHRPFIADCVVHQNAALSRDTPATPTFEFE